jgi:hypothetical protein
MGKRLQGSQKQDSAQSANQGPDTSEQTGKARKGVTPAGIGSSQGQDEEKREPGPGTERPSSGTPDVERSSSGTPDIERGARSEESLVQDPVGAYKERP